MHKGWVFWTHVLPGGGKWLDFSGTRNIQGVDESRWWVYLEDGHPMWVLYGVGMSWDGYSYPIYMKHWFLWAYGHPTISSLLYVKSISQRFHFLSSFLFVLKIRAQKEYVVTMVNVQTTSTPTSADVNQISQEPTVRQR